MPIPSASPSLQHRPISSHSSLATIQSFARNILPASKATQHKQILSHKQISSPLPAKQLFTQNVHLSPKLSLHYKQTLSQLQHKQISRSLSPSAQHNRLTPVRQGREEE